MERKWWKEAFGYQIYPRSFNDTNGDGIGDLRGIIEKLDYLEDLGINLIWICPFYKSPMDDNGYDVSDYYDIDPMFGSLDDMKNLIKEAHARGIKILADLVLNHTSDEHPWFVEARKSKDNKYRNYYIWQSPRIINGNEIEPTNWASFFGGSSWEKDELTGDYFMKIFSNKMPDLNWANTELRREMYDMTNWWLDLGIDGFRVDAVAHLDRAPFVDSKMKSDNRYKPDWSKFSNLPKVHEYIKEMNKETFGKYDVMTVGEVGGDATPRDALKYAGFKSGEFNMVFNFDHNWCNNMEDAKELSEVKTDLIELKKTFNKWQKGMYGKGWNPLYWYNHDHPRVVSIYGDDLEYRVESAKMLATALYLMWGTPFIYQGEEIGMTNYKFSKVSEIDDIGVKNSFQKEVVGQEKTETEFFNRIEIISRDNSRTMMQWNDTDNAGFSKKQPWYLVNDNYKEINVENQRKDDDSILNYYKKINYLRRTSEFKEVIVYGTYKQLMKKNKQIYAYMRKCEDRKLLVVCNFFKEETKVSITRYEAKNVILSNYKDPSKKLKEITLRPFEAIVYEIK